MNVVMETVTGGGGGGGGRFFLFLENFTERHFLQRIVVDTFVCFTLKSVAKLSD